MGLDYDGAGVVWLESPLPLAAFEKDLWSLMSADGAAGLTPGKQLPFERERELDGFFLVPAVGGEGVSGLVWSGGLYWTAILDTLDEFAACAPGARATVIGYINAIGAELYSSHVFYDVERGFDRTDEYTTPPGATWVYEPRPRSTVFRATAKPEAGAPPSR